MIYIGIALLLGAALLALVEQADGNTVMKKYCDMECIENQRRVCC